MSTLPSTSAPKLAPTKAILLALLGLGFAVEGALAQTEEGVPGTGPIQVTDFLPDGYVTDGSVSYQGQIQKAIDSAAATGSTIAFAPMIYRISDPVGLQLHSHLTLRMDGATFLLDEGCAEDGQVFFGENVTDLRFEGGTILGHNDTWPDGINLRGIHLTGECRNIRIRDMEIRDLSSNGIGVFAQDDDHPATDIWVVDTVIHNCSNKFGDYRAPPPEKRGPENGSTREDQGLIAMYHVHDFVVRGCRLEDSRSDGTHFCLCRRGQFTDNRVYRANMGGYFLETCHHILAANNVIQDNGSRGVTIERGSQHCTLIGNTISNSGREGLWIPDSLRCVVTGNVFSLNGRKPNDKERHTLWNANITINQARGDKLNTPTAHYLIADNLIETDHQQIAAIRVDTRTETKDIVIRGNLLIGDNKRIRIEGPDQDAVVSTNNHGSVIERVNDEE